MPSVDVQHELATIFERLDQIESQIDAFETELRRKAAALTPTDPLPRP